MADPGRGSLLRRVDQACVAAVVFVSLAGIGVVWLYRGGHRGRLIEVDRAPRRRIGYRIDINRAGWAEWAVLPGIGERVARRIVRYREEEGPFTSHQDLLRVPGVGPKTLQRIRPYLLPVTPASPP